MEMHSAGIDLGKTTFHLRRDGRQGSGPLFAQSLLRKLVLDAISSPHSERNYANALDDLF
jgi:hypothetical protein